MNRKINLDRPHGVGQFVREFPESAVALKRMRAATRRDGIYTLGLRARFVDAK